MIKTIPFFQNSRLSFNKSGLALTLAMSSLLAVSSVTACFAEKPQVDAKQKAKEQVKEDLRKSMNSKGEFIRTASDDTGEAIPADKDGKLQVDASTSGASANVSADTVDGAAAKKAQDAIALSNLATDHYELGRHYMHKFDWEMSEIEMEAAIMCSPTMKAAHRDYCVVSLMRGQPLRSLAEFMMVVGMGDPIPFNDAEKAALVKKAAKLHYQKGLNYGVLHQWKKATPEFQWALSYVPTSAAIAHSLAFSYAAAGDFENAESEYLKAFALDPSNSYSHADFAVLLAEHGDPKKAMEELAKAISLSPGVAALHVDMAWLAESSGDFKTAETEFHQAVELSPKHAGLWSHLGRVEERLGKAKDAKIAYSQALAVDPGDDEAIARLKVLEKSTPGAPAAGDAPTQANPDQSKKQS